MIKRLSQIILFIFIFLPLLIIAQPPTEQARNITITPAGAGSVDIAWEGGNGDKSLVVIKQGGSVTEPDFITTYVGNPVFGSGDNIDASGSFVVYADNGTSVTVTNLDDALNYTVQVFEYNETSLLGLLTTETNNPLNFTTSGASGGGGGGSLTTIKIDDSGSGTLDPDGIVNFGSTNINANGTELTFTIEYTGVTNIVLSNPAVTISSGGDFVLTEEPAKTTLNGGETTTFKVQFVPKDIGLLVGDVLIYNENNEEAIIVPLEGTGQNIVITNPSDFEAKADNDNGIVLTWKDNSNNEDGFDIFRSLTGDSDSFILLSSVGANVKTFTDNTLATNQKAYYKIQAWSNDGGISDEVGPVNATTKNPPEVPQNLVAETYSQSQINLSWVDASEIESGFAIERSSDVNSGFVQLTLVAANTTSYEDKNLENNTVYNYRIKALNSTQGDSDFSNISGAKTADIPLPPSDLKLTTNDERHVVINWTDNANNEGFFRIERSNELVTQGRFDVIAETSTDVTTYVDSTASPNQIYFYRIRAANINGISIATDEVKIETPFDPNVARPSQAPQELVAESVSEFEIATSWRPIAASGRGSRNVNNFVRIESATDASGPFTEVARVSTSTNRYQFTNLDKNLTYFIRIAQGNDGGYSDYSDVVSAQPSCQILASVSDDKEDVVVSICDGKSAFLVLNTNVINATYQWTRNGLTLPNSNQRFFYATENGVYNCNITSGSCTKTADVAVTVTLKESIDMSISQVDNTLEANLTSANAYQWYRDDIPITSANSFRHTPSEDGLYYVVASQDGCATTSNFIFFTTTSIDEVISDEIQVYPNPTSDKINLIWENDYLGAYQLNLYDLQGKQYSFGNGKKTNYTLEDTLDLSIIPSGTYLLEMIGEGFRASRKIIKE